jgi:pimeloyl-ACP methyl ester carboxylesterase
MQVLLKPVIYLGIPVLGLNPFQIRVSDALRKIDKPTLVLHGEKDTLALPKAAEGNYAALKGPKKLVWFPGRNHAEARWEDPEKYFEEVLGFLREHFQS